jgi:hypothetical protein
MVPARSGLVGGVRSGDDRLVLQGHRRSLYRRGGLARYGHTNAARNASTAQRVGLAG